MAILALTNAYVSVGGNAISPSVRRVSINYERATVDPTAMGATTRGNLAALYNWSAEIEFNQDYASSAIDSIISPLVGTEVALEFRPTTSSVGVSNPKWTATGLITSYNPISGSVGDMSVGTITIVPGSSSSTNALTRATS